MPTIRQHACCQSCYWMLPMHVFSSFLIPTVVSFMASTNWCLPSGLSSKYTLDFMQSWSKKSNGFKSGDWVGQITSPPHPIHLSSLFLLKIPLPLCWYVEVLHHVAATFIFMLQEAHPLNAAIIHFPENSSNMEMLNIRAGQSSYWLSLHTTC
jgi:hypothetical protein